MNIKLYLYLFVTFGLLLTGCSFKDPQYSIVNENNKDGIINQDGYVVVKPQYKQILNFDTLDTMALNKYFILFNSFEDNSEPYAIIQDTNGKYGVMNQHGKLLLKPIYDSVTYFFDGFMRVEIGGNFGLVDQNFKVILKPIYTSISPFTDNIAIVEHKGHFGCINKDMELKISPKYDAIYFQQEDFLRIRLNGKWGYLDNECNILSKPIYDYVYNFSNNIAKVILNNKVGYINSEGKMLSKQIFETKSLSF